MITSIIGSPCKLPRFARFASLVLRRRWHHFRHPSEFVLDCGRLPQPPVDHRILPPAQQPEFAPTGKIPISPKDVELFYLSSPQHLPRITCRTLLEGIGYREVLGAPFALLLQERPELFPKRCIGKRMILLGTKYQRMTDGEDFFLAVSKRFSHSREVIMELVPLEEVILPDEPVPHLKHRNPLAA